MEILDGKLDKILNKAGNLDLELYRTLCKVEISGQMLERKSDILSQKDYDRPLEIKIPENKLFMSDKSLLEPIRENYTFLN